VLPATVLSAAASQMSIYEIIGGIPRQCQDTRTRTPPSLRTSEKWATSFGLSVGNVANPTEERLPRDGFRALMKDLVVVDPDAACNTINTLMKREVVKLPGTPRVAFLLTSTNQRWGISQCG